MVGSGGLLGGEVGSFSEGCGCIVVFVLLVILCSLFMSRIRFGVMFVDSRLFMLLCFYVTLV